MCIKSDVIINMMEYQEVNDQHIIELAEQINSLRSYQADSRRSLNDLLPRFRDVLANLKGENWFMGKLAVRKSSTATRSINKFYQELSQRGIEPEILNQCLEASKISSTRIHIELRPVANHTSEGNGRHTSKMPRPSVTASNDTDTRLSPNPSQICPFCTAPMVIRLNQSLGTKFWGCSKYPACKGTRNLPLDQQTNGANNRAETIANQVLATTERQERIDPTVDRRTKLQTPISELPIGEPITKPLFEKQTTGK